MSKAAEEQGERALEALKQMKGGVVQVRRDMLAANNAVNQFVGERRAYKTVSILAEAMPLARLRELRDTKAFRHVIDPETGENIKSFDAFCKLIGENEHAVNEQIRVLDKLGEEFLALQAASGIRRQHVRLLLAAPSEVQAEAVNIARANAHGQDVTERLAELEERIYDLAQSHADKMKLIEQRADAEAARDAAESKAEKAVEKSKSDEKRRKEAEDKAAKLKEEVETPPRLRSPQMARAFLDRYLHLAEALAGRLEETAETCAGNLEAVRDKLMSSGKSFTTAQDEAWAQVKPLAHHAHDVACAAMNRLLIAYEYLIRATGPLDAEAHPMMCAVAGIIRGDGDLIRMAKLACDQLKAAGQAEPQAPAQASC